MAKKEKITVKKIDDAKKAKKGSEEKEAKPAKGKGKDGKGKDRSKWAAHEADLGTELAALGLRIKDITGDGNCFFRALGDQLKGEEKVHAELRARIVGFMADHEEEFAPFVEDDESFGSYIARMKKDGTWAGYMEVVAASRCLGANLTIYQAGQPRWRVVHHPEDTAPMLHLAYSDGQHYDSVRCADDYGHGPAAPVVIRGDGTVPARPQRPAGSEPWDERDEARVAASTACRDLGLVRAALAAAGGDVEAAVEKVIEMLAEQVEAEEGAEGVGEKEKDVEAAAEKEGEAGGEGGVSDGASITNGAGDKSGGRGVGGDGGGGSGGKGETATGAAPFEDELKAGRCGETTAAGAAAAGEAAGPAPAPAEARVPSTALRETDAAATSATAASAARVTAATATAATATAATATAATATAASATSATAPSSSAAGPGGASADATGGAGEPAPVEAKGAGRKAPDSAKRRGIVVGSRSSSSSSSAAAAGSSSAPANNKRCPCGSNKKYKACCGPAAAAAARRKASAGEVEVEAVAGLGTTVVAQVAALVI